MAGLLGELVGIESGSHDPDGLAAMADRLEDLFCGSGRIARYPTGPVGTSHLVLTVDGADSTRRSPHAVVLGHFDTVWERGTLERKPFAVDDGVASGPGAFDMKGGLVLLYYALTELQALGRAPRRPLRVLFGCDEELGSPTSRKLIAAMASGAAVAFVLESPLPGGVLKTARKGGRIYRLEIEGRAAHAGIEPHKGASAIIELAHQVLAVDALSDPELGTTINVGVVGGGSRLNVVPAHAEAEIVARVAIVAEAERIDEAMAKLQPVTSGTRLSVAPGLSRLPMERTAASGRLFDRARSIAAAMGVPDLREGSTGGASDGNLVAAMGIPTLDGLGPDGGGAHADDEHVVIASLPERAALLAGLLAEV